MCQVPLQSWNLSGACILNQKPYDLNQPYHMQRAHPGPRAVRREREPAHRGGLRVWGVRNGDGIEKRTDSVLVRGIVRADVDDSQALR